MEAYAATIVAFWLGIAAIAACLILIGFTIASIFISVPLWAVALCSIGGGLVLSTVSFVVPR
jgi:hypothetical protein